MIDYPILFLISCIIMLILIGIIIYLDQKLMIIEDLLNKNKVVKE